MPIYMKAVQKKLVENTTDPKLILCLHNLKWLDFEGRPYAPAIFLK